MLAGPMIVKGCSTILALGLLLSSTQASAGGRPGPRRCLQFLTFALALFSPVQGVGWDATGPARPVPPFDLDGPGGLDSCEPPLPVPLPIAPSTAPAILGFEGAIPAKTFTFLNPYDVPWRLEADAFPMDLYLQVNQERPVKVRQGDRWHGDLPAGASFTLRMAKPDEPGGEVIIKVLDHKGRQRQWEITLGNLS
jgi:hypothetical protein